VRRIAIVPVYNEEATLRPVLDSLAAQVDLVVIVDDGSSDGSLGVARRCAQQDSRICILHLPQNRGMSAALREGFMYLALLLEDGALDPGDLVFTMDADGQHDSREIDSLAEHVARRDLDVALTRRDFALYPRHKRWGNRLMTAWGSLWSGFRYDDIESGFRAMRLRVIPPLMEYYSGRRYSCAQEIAVLTARLGFRVDNSFGTVIQLYRSQTGLKDVMINAAMSAWAFLRWRLRCRIGRRAALAQTIAAAGPVARQGSRAAAGP